MKASLRATAAWLILGVLGLATVGGCPGWPFFQPASPSTTGDAGLQRFTSGDELLNYFKQQATASISRGISGPGGFLDLLAPAAAGADAGIETSNSGASGDQTTAFSTTNLQETGVDESDVFKSDGTNFYIAQGDTLRIVRATPTSEMRELGQLKFGDRIDSLYLFGGKVIVLLEKNNFVLMAGVTPTTAGAEATADIASPMMWPPYDVRATVSVAAVDVSDPANPAVAARNDLDGVLVSSRLTNGHLVLVLTYEPSLPTVVAPLSIATMSLTDVLPKMDVGQGPAVLVPPEDWYHPLSPDGYFATMVVTLDAADVTTVVGSTAVMAGAGTIYSSTEALYLTDTTYDENNSFRETTAIHKLAYNEQGVAEYVASGSVPGRLLNQFSLSEFGGNLRVATQVDDVRFFGGPILFGEGAVGIAVAEASMSSSDAVTTQTAQTAADVPTGPYNAVYVVAPNADKLDVVGRLENIAPGEQLYAARFLDKHAFLVTFRQIDPLFVLDLTDPNSPKSVGELMIPGYSDYLHPYGDNLLIGVGRSTETSPWGGVVRNGLQLSLFDVSDWTNPTLVQQLDLGGYGSESDVSVTHKAFTFLPDQGLLAIPAVLYPTGYDPYIDSVYVGPSFDGALVYQVSPTGFAAKGRVSSVVYTDAYGMTYVQWRRAAFIGQTAYAVTSDGVRAAPLADMDTPTTVTLASDTP